MGFSDNRLSKLAGSDLSTVIDKRQRADVFPVFRRVDTCAGEFASQTCYMYSTYGALFSRGSQVCEANPTARRKIMILGSGPNRIGQGIEFDYCCVHAALALREDGYATHDDRFDGEGESLSGRQSGTGILLVGTKPIGTEIHIDGKLIGYAPKVVNDLSAGEHKVRLVLDGDVYEVAVTIKPDFRTKLNHTW